jgi:hypothetical protein
MVLWEDREMGDEFFDPSEEPDPICANCNSFDRAGRPFDDPPFDSRCLNKQARRGRVTMADRCKHFFPDAKMWPDADHD